MSPLPRRNTARALFATLFLASTLGAGHGLTHAQTWPSKPIRFILPFPPGGGGIDVMARAIGQRMTETFAQPVLVENRAGASGAIAGEFVARAAPDGHTFFFTTPGIIVTSLFVPNLPFDARKDFTPVTAVVEPVTCVVVGPAVTAAHLKDFIEFAKKNPTKVFYASNGVGSFFHLAGELLNQQAGTEMTHVPYKGAPSVVQDLLTGRIHMAMNSISSMSSQIRSGKFRVLAVLERNRYRGLPDVPSLSEPYPNFEKPASWWAFLAPANLPPAIANRFQAEVARFINLPDTQKILEQDALTAIANTPEQFAIAYRNGFEVYNRAYKAAGIKPEL